MRFTELTPEQAANNTAACQYLIEGKYYRFWQTFEHVTGFISREPTAYDELQMIPDLSFLRGLYLGYREENGRGLHAFWGRPECDEESTTIECRFHVDFVGGAHVELDPDQRPTSTGRLILPPLRLWTPPPVATSLWTPDAEEPNPVAPPKPNLVPGAYCRFNPPVVTTLYSEIDGTRSNRCVKLTFKRGYYVSTSVSGEHRFRGTPTKASDRRKIQSKKGRECFFAVSSQANITVIVDETVDED